MGLKEKIQNIKIIDHHVHAVDPFYWLGPVGVYPFAEFNVKLPTPNRFTTIRRKETLFAGYREIYDFPYSDLTPDNEKELDDLYQKSLQGDEEGKMFMKAMDKAGIESALQMCLSEPILPPGLDSNRFARAQLVDGFLIPLDNSGIGETARVKQFVKMVEVYPAIMRKQINPQSFDEYLNMISVTLENLVKEGVVALKMNHAYWRDIAIDVADKKEAEDVFNKKDTTPARYKVLQDYIMRHMIAKAAILDLPIHIHTGALGIAQPMEMSNPARFDSFLWLPDIRKAKVVLLHGSYPYCREAGFMVSRMGDVPSLYLDLSMMIYSIPDSPEAIVGILRDWLQAGLAEKIIYGSDTTNVINVFVAAANIREALYLALQGMIDDGCINESQAFSMAEMILRENAKKLYKNKI